MDSPSITARAPFRSNSPLELLPFGSRSFDFCWVRSQCSQVLQGLVDCDDPSIVAIDGDIGRPEMAERVVSQTVARFVRIDMPINNAGVSILAFDFLARKAMRIHQFARNDGGIARQLLPRMPSIARAVLRR